MHSLTRSLSPFGRPPSKAHTQATLETVLACQAAIAELRSLSEATVFPGTNLPSEDALPDTVMAMYSTLLTNAGLAQTACTRALNTLSKKPALLQFWNRLTNALGQIRMLAGPGTPVNDLSPSFIRAAAFELALCPSTHGVYAILLANQTDEFKLAIGHKGSGRLPSHHRFTVTHTPSGGSKINLNLYASHSTRMMYDLLGVAVRNALFLHRGFTPATFQSTMEEIGKSELIR